MKKVLTKILLLALALVFTVATFGCGKTKEAEITFTVYSADGATTESEEVVLKIDLYKRSAPKTVEQFINLAKEGYYNNTFFYMLGDSDYASQLMLGKLKYTGNYSIEGTNKQYEVVKNKEVAPIKGEFDKNGVTGSELKNTKYSIGLWRRFDLNSDNFTAFGEKTYDTGSSSLYFLNSDKASYNGNFAVFAQIQEDYKETFDDLMNQVKNIENYEEYTIYYTGTDAENLKFNIALSEDYDEMVDNNKIADLFEPEEDGKYYYLAPMTVKIPVAGKRIVLKSIEF
ncbi:MAG: hypothetical protein E7342_03330 [Clostridiales bacterium]|nr:hypothetical protein [Clostridiales bacterium]